jgi:hypothetical protein
LARHDLSLEVSQRRIQLNGTVASCLIGRRQLLAGGVLASGAHQVIGFDREGQSPQAVRASLAQTSSGVVRSCRRASLQTTHRVVDLRPDAGAVLCVIRLLLGEDEFTRKLRRCHRGQYRPLPIGHAAVAPATGEEQADEHGRQGDGNGKDDPAPRCG